MDIFNHQTEIVEIGYFTDFTPMILQVGGVVSHPWPAIGVASSTFLAKMELPKFYFFNLSLDNFLIFLVFDMA